MKSRAQADLKSQQWESKWTFKDLGRDFQSLFNNLDVHFHLFYWIVANKILCVALVPEVWIWKREFGKVKLDFVLFFISYIYRSIQSISKNSQWFPSPSETVKGQELQATEESLQGMKGNYKDPAQQKGCWHSWSCGSIASPSFLP